jgi:hypothetical protein
VAKASKAVAQILLTNFANINDLLRIWQLGRFNNIGRLCK